MKIEELDIKYECDKCGYTFEGNKVKLEKYATNISIFGVILVVDEKGTIIRTGNPKETDRTLNCPKCGFTHLFGFNLAIT